MSLIPEQVAPPECILEDLLNKWCLLRDNIDDTTVYLAVRICKILQHGDRYSELDIFLKALPLQDIYTKNEFIVRAKISVAFHKRDFRLLYRLIEGHIFQHYQEDLIKIWDEAHYAEEEMRTGKALTSLLRFRVRQRNTPPKTICPTQVRKKNALPRESKTILQAWIQENINYPYPTKDTKEYLAKKANLTIEQVKTWFNNARRLMHMNGYNRLYSQVKKRKIDGNERSDVDDDASKSLVSDGDKANHSEDMEQDELVSAHDINQENIKESSTAHSENTCSVRVLCEIDVSQNLEVTTCRVPVVRHTSEATPSYHDETKARPQPSFHNSNAADVLPSRIPQLELVHPSVIVNPNLYPQLPYQAKLRKCSSSFPFDDVWYSLLDSRHREPCNAPYCPYNDFEQNTPSIPTFQNPFQLDQELPSIMTAPCKKEPINCHQELNALNQDLTSPRCSSPVGARAGGVVWGSPKQMMRQFDAATALLEMSGKYACAVCPVLLINENV